MGRRGSSARGRPEAGRLTGTGGRGNEPSTRTVRAHSRAHPRRSTALRGAARFMLAVTACGSRTACRPRPCPTARPIGPQMLDACRRSEAAARGGRPEAGRATGTGGRGNEPSTRTMRAHSRAHPRRSTALRAAARFMLAVTACGSGTACRPRPCPTARPIGPQMLDACRRSEAAARGGRPEAGRATGTGGRGNEPSTRTMRAHSRAHPRRSTALRAAARFMLAVTACGSGTACRPRPCPTARPIGPQMLDACRRSEAAARGGRPEAGRATGTGGRGNEPSTRTMRAHSRAHPRRSTALRGAARFMLAVTACGSRTACRPRPCPTARPIGPQMLDACRRSEAAARGGRPEAGRLTGTGGRGNEPSTRTMRAHSRAHPRRSAALRAAARFMLAVTACGSRTACRPRPCPTARPIGPQMLDACRRSEAAARGGRPEAGRLTGTGGRGNEPSTRTMRAHSRAHPRRSAALRAAARFMLAVTACGSGTACRPRPCSTARPIAPQMLDACRRSEAAARGAGRRPAA